MAHTNAIFSPPGAGGILLEEAEGDFRIDHDQKFNTTTNLQYVFNKARGAWAALCLAVRLGSGRRRGGQPRRRAGADRRSAGGDRILLRQQVGDARRAADRRRLLGDERGAKRLNIPAGRDRGRRGQSAAHCAAASVRPRPRRRQPAPHATGAKLRVRFSVINLTNKEALYNFLSTFSGTHFVTPRAYQVQVGVTF